MPTNAMVPAEATLKAARDDASISMSGIMICVRIPKVWASTLPSSRIFIKFPKNGDKHKKEAATIPHNT